jgi:diguanylate cyclase (GGDEF)-like protein/PAS domain S-box-containing protein
MGSPTPILAVATPQAYLAAVVAVCLFAPLAARLAAGRRRAEADAARHFELSLDLICVAGLDGRLKRVNPAFESAFGYREEELVGRSLSELVHPDDRERTERRMAATSDGEGAVRFESRWFDRRGEVHWLEWSSTMLVGEGSIYSVARDVTDRKQLEREVARLSQRDPLTGLFNRRRFDEELRVRLDDARREDRGGALLLIDLDHFKAINDELGYAAGDVALREVARVLAENTRGTDALGRGADGLVARVGGDEFAVLLAEVGPVEAAVVGERLVAALEATDLRVEGNLVSLAVSVGVAPYEGRTAVEAEELMALADRAMYVVKAGGGSGSGEARPAGRGPGVEPA